jgi:hypothetical protein
MSPDRSNITVKSRLVGALIGMLIGQAAWAVSVLAALVCPGPIFTPIAFPITYFVLLFIWPNELAPQWLSWWVDSDTSNVTFGLSF